MPTLFGILDFGPAELMVIGALAVLLYGKNLPEAGRSIGKHLGQLRKSMSGIEDEIRSTTQGLGLPILPGSKISRAFSALDTLTRTSSPSPAQQSAKSAPAEAVSDLDEPTAPKFEPPPA